MTSAVQPLFDGLRSVIRGKDEFLKQLLGCFLAGGHVLIEDVPGLGKTTVAKTLAALVAGDDGERSFRRIQCTPDLLPYDITGVDVFNPEKRAFEFLPGPVFAHVLLADEINRTTPKVQSALLEVMGEGQVTVGTATRRLEQPFFVIATQNPVEFEGTYNLPLAQADRFLMKLSIGYPSGDAEFDIVNEDPAALLPDIKPVCGPAGVLELQAAAARVHCSEVLTRAVVRTAALSREHKAVQYGVSPRGSLMLVKAARARAFVEGRDYVTDEDLLELAPLVLGHRLRLKDVRQRSAELVEELCREALRLEKV